jgi:O-antigen/teichoic acid export membrane protein
MFAEQMMRMLAGLLVGIWVARYLGPAQFGLFSYAVAFAALFSSIAKLGLDSIMVRDLVREPAQRDIYMGTAFWLKLAGSLAMLGVIGIALQLTTSDSTTRLYIFIIASGAIFQPFEVVDFYFQSKVLSKFVSICKLIQLTISSLIKIFLIYIDSGLFWFVIVSLIDQITLAATLYLAYRCQKIGMYFKHFNRHVAKKLLIDSWPLVLSGLAVMIYMRTDQIMIKEMLGEKEVGLYSAATRISEIWYFVPILITNSIFPAILNVKKDSPKYLFRLRVLFSVLVWIGILVAAITAFIYDWLIIFLYGQDYQQAGQVLMIHIWGGIFVALGAASGSWFVSENLQRYALYRTLLGASVNIALNFALIPKYGILGAAIGTVVAQSVAALFFDILTAKTRVLFFTKLKSIFLIGITKKNFNA